MTLRHIMEMTDAHEPVHPTRVITAVACFGALLLIGTGNQGLGGLMIAIGVVALMAERNSPLRHREIGLRSIVLMLVCAVAAISVVLPLALAAGNPYRDLPAGIGAAAGAITVIGITVLSERLDIGQSDRGAWALAGALLTTLLYGIAVTAYGI